MSQPPNARFLDATQYSVSWFWKRLQADELDMQPPYQRNPVWQEQQKAFLLDSIINGFPVPELYLQTKTDSDGDEIHTLVDGQQRIRACMEFIAGRFPLRSDTPSLEGLYFNDLDDELKMAIFKYKFVVRSLPDMTDREVREIFGRLNRNNVALNRQELRHSTYWGAFISTMSELSQRPFWIKSGLFTSNDFRRMLDIEYVSELSVSVLFGAQNKKNRLDYYYGLFEDEFPDRERLVETFDAVIAELNGLFVWPNSLRWSRKVDFYTLFSVLAARWMRDGHLEMNGPEVAEHLQELAVAVGRILSLADSEEDDEAQREHPGALAYARGVRNSSDLGSRRMRARGLANYVWGDPMDDLLKETSHTSESIDRLPKSEDLMTYDQFSDEDYED